MKNPIFLGAIALGLIAATVTFLYFKKKNAPPPAGPKPKAQYVVAKEAIAPRLPVNETMVEISTEEGAQDAAFCADVNEVIGKSVSVAVAKGEKIRKNILTASAKTFPIPPGKRALALFFDPNLTTAGLLNVGDHVDVNVVYPEGSDAVARTVSQNNEVIAIDAPGAPPPASNEGGKAEAKSESKASTASEQTAAGQKLRVVLAVNPDEVASITAASDKGDIRLTIRNPQDLLSAKVEEEWEHPHRVHKHFPFPAPASPENIPKRPTGPTGAGPAAKTPSPLPSLPTIPAAGGIPGSQGIGSKAGMPKSVEVVRGTTKELVPVRE